MLFKKVKLLIFRYSEGRSSRGKTMETLENSLVIDGLVAFQVSFIFFKDKY